MFPREAGLQTSLGRDSNLATTRKGAHSTSTSQTGRAGHRLRSITTCDVQGGLGCPEGTPPPGRGERERPRRRDGAQRPPFRWPGSAWASDQPNTERSFL